MSASIPTNSYGKKKAPSPLRAKITGREDGPVGYTGDEAGSGEIDTSVEAGEKTFKDHVNEIYLSAGTVNVLGGKDEAQKKIESLIKNEIDNADKRSVFSLKPITATSSSKAGYESAGVVSDQDTFAKSQGYGTFAEYKAAGAKPNEDLAKSQGFNSFSDYSAAEGKKAADYYATTSTPPVSATTTATGMYKPLSAQALINQGANYLKSTAEGNNPIIQAQKEAASAKTAAETAGGKGELQMRLTQAGTTGGAAEAATSAYDRDARIRASQEQTALTQQGMAQAQAANESLVNLGQAERTYAENQKLNADNLLNSAMSGITNILAANPNATVETNPELRTFLNTIYQQGGGQGEAPADFIANRLAIEKQNIDSGYQTRMSIGDATSIANTFFNGDVEAMNKFSWGGKTGEEAVRNAWEKLSKTGGLVKDAQGNLIADQNNALYKAMFAPESSKGVIASGTVDAAGNVPVGTKVKVGNDDLVVEKQNPDGSYTLYEGNIEYTGTWDGAKMTTIPTGNNRNFKDGKFIGTGPVTTTSDEPITASFKGVNYPVERDSSGNFTVKIGDTIVPLTESSIDYDEGDVTLPAGEVTIGGKIYSIIDGAELKDAETGAEYTQVEGLPGVVTLSGTNDYKTIVNGSYVPITTKIFATKQASMTPEQRTKFADILANTGQLDDLGFKEIKDTLYSGKEVPVELLVAAIKKDVPDTRSDVVKTIIDQKIDINKYPGLLQLITSSSSTDPGVGSVEKYWKSEQGHKRKTKVYKPVKKDNIPSVGSTVVIDGKPYYVKSSSGRKDAGNKYWYYPKTLVALDGTGSTITRQYLST